MSKNFVDYSDITALITKIKAELDKKAVVVVLTKAEYEALSLEEKNNGTIYFITDYNEFATGNVIRTLVRCYYNSQDEKFYQEATFENEVIKGANYLYIDLNSYKMYIYDPVNKEFILVGGNGDGIKNIKMNGNIIPKSNDGEVDLGNILTNYYTYEEASSDNAYNYLKPSGNMGQGASSDFSYTENSGQVMISGGPTSDDFYYIVSNDFRKFLPVPTDKLTSLEVGKEYKLLGCPKNGSSSTYKLYLRFQLESSIPDTSSTIIIAEDFGEGVKFTMPEFPYGAILQACIYVNKDYVCDNLTFNCMIVSANNPMTTFKRNILTNKELTEWVRELNTIKYNGLGFGGYLEDNINYRQGITIADNETVLGDDGSYHLEKIMLEANSDEIVKYISLDPHIKEITINQITGSWKKDDGSIHCLYNPYIEIYVTTTENRIEIHEKNLTSESIPRGLTNLIINFEITQTGSAN